MVNVEQKSTGMRPNDPRLPIVGRDESATLAASSWRDPSSPDAAAGFAVARQLGRVHASVRDRPEHAPHGGA